MAMTAATRDRRPKTRARRLRLHPLCVDCLKFGETKATEEIDHIVPLEYAGKPMDEQTLARLIDLGLVDEGESPDVIPLELDVDGNTQGLCIFHNRQKRNREVYGHKSYGLDGWPEE